MSEKSDEPIPAAGQSKYETLDVNEVSDASVKKRQRKHRVRKFGCPTQYAWSLDVYGPLLLLILVVASCFVFTRVEHWNFWAAMYFCITTLTTVGYGDLTPNNSGLKIFTVIFIYIGFILIAVMSGHVYGRIVGRDLRPPKKTALLEKQPCWKTDLGLTSMWLIGFALAGTIFYTIHDDLSNVDSLYLSMITLSTVGYGDISRDKTATMIFDVLFALFGVPLLLIVLLLYAEKWAMREHQLQIDSDIRKGLSLKLVKAIEEENTGEIERAEFIAYLLVHMGKVTPMDINKVNVIFNSFEPDKDGVLDINTVQMIMEQHKASA